MGKPYDTIVLYTFEKKNGEEFSSYSTQNAIAAKAHAQKHGLRWIANTFTFEDSELVEDYTQD